MSEGGAHLRSLTLSMNLHLLAEHRYRAQTSAKCVLGGVLGQPQELEREDPGDDILGPLLLSPYPLEQSCIENNVT